MVVFGPMFFGGEYSYTYDVCTQVVFFPEALWDPEAGLIIVPVRARLFFTLSDLSVSLWFSIVMPVGSCICIEDVQRILTVILIAWRLKGTGVLLC